MAAGHSIDPGRWQETFEVLMERVARAGSHRWNRGAGPERRSSEYSLTCHARTVRLSPSTRAKGGSTGCSTCCRARSWDAGSVRDDIRSFLIEYLHHDDAVLVFHETADLKKETVGVQC